MDTKTLSIIVRESVRAEMAQAGIISQSISTKEAKRIYGPTRIKRWIETGQVRRYRIGDKKNSPVYLLIEELLQAELTIIRS